MLCRSTYSRPEPVRRQQCAEARPGRLSDTEQLPGAAVVRVAPARGLTAEPSWVPSAAGPTGATVRRPSGRSMSWWWSGMSGCVLCRSSPCLRPRVRCAVGGRRWRGSRTAVRRAAARGSWSAAARRATAWRGGPVRHDHPCLEGGLVVWPPRADGPPGIIARRGVVATAACSSWLASPAGAGAPAVAARLLPEDPEPGTESKQPGPWTRPDQRRCVVGATGFEPVASSVSAKCKEPLCGTPFPQVMPDRRGRS